MLVLDSIGVILTILIDVDLLVLVLSRLRRCSCSLSNRLDTVLTPNR
jgi:hypothetical protein